MKTMPRRNQLTKNFGQQQARAIRAGYREAIKIVGRELPKKERNRLLRQMEHATVVARYRNLLRTAPAEIGIAIAGVGGALPAMYAEHPIVGTAIAAATLIPLARQAGNIRNRNPFFNAATKRIVLPDSIRLAEKSAPYPINPTRIEAAHEGIHFLEQQGLVPFNLHPTLNALRPLASKEEHLSTAMQALENYLAKLHPMPDNNGQTGYKFEREHAYNHSTWQAREMIKELNGRTTAIGSNRSRARGAQLGIQAISLSHHLHPQAGKLLLYYVAKGIEAHEAEAIVRRKYSTRRANAAETTEP